MSTGSYPVMDLARDFNVDYGDVLLMADDYRRFMGGEVPTWERVTEFERAEQRLFQTLHQRGETKRFAALARKLMQHARRRWGGCVER